MIVSHPCPYCKEDIKPNAIVCKHCGMNLQTGQKVGTSQPQTQPVKKKNNGCLTLLILAVIAIVIYLIVPKPEPTALNPDPKINHVIADDSYKQQMIVPIRSCMNATPEQVQRILGKPNKIITGSKVDCASTRVNHCIEMHYKKDSITVMYTQINRLSYWFEFDHLQAHRFTKLYEILGLEEMPPTEEGNGFVWYKNYKGFGNISFIPLKSDETKLDYAIVESDFMDIPMNSFR